MRTNYEEIHQEEKKQNKMKNSGENQEVSSKDVETLEILCNEYVLYATDCQYNTNECDEYANMQSRPNSKPSIEKHSLFE